MSRGPWKQQPGKEERRATAPEDWLLRDVWEWAEDVRRTHSLTVSVWLLPTRRPGVWAVRTAAARLAEGATASPVVMYQFEHPSSQRSTLAAALLLATVKLSKMLDEGASQPGPFT